MEKEIVKSSSSILEILPTLISIALGVFLSTLSAFFLEKQKIKKEEREKKFNAKLKMFQTLEFIEKKCEHYIMDYSYIGDPLELEQFPSFDLIDVDELSSLKFLIKSNYKKQYKKFLEIEQDLKERRKYIIGELNEIKSGRYNNGPQVYRELSEETHTELVKIIIKISDIKEII